MAQATNGMGWVVQQYIRENGWIAVTKPRPCREEVDAEHAAQYAAMDPPSRVYEQLNHPNQRNA